MYHVEFERRKYPHESIFIKRKSCYYYRRRQGDRLRRCESLCKGKVWLWSLLAAPHPLWNTERKKLKSRSPAQRSFSVPVMGKDHEMAQRVVDKAIETFGRLDIVVNNAQQFLPDTRVENFTHEDLIATYESGLFAAWRYMIAAFPHLKAVKGTVINMGSASGTKSRVNECAYGGNKEAMRHLSRVAAKEWGEYGITVNVVCPAVASETALEYAAQNPDWEEAFLSEFPLRKWGDAELHVGGTCVFLAKPEGKYITGSTIDVDGGFIYQTLTHKTTKAPECDTLAPLFCILG